jgi:hypothetical protein
MADYEQAVFISYAWGGEREDIVNEIDETLQQRGIRIVRDKRALGYRGSIKDFMERIGRGSCIIVVISDKYLRSPNCMFELVEIADNKQFHDRIFPVVLSDANIYDPLKRIEYIKFWEGKRKELAKAMKTLDPANLQGIREEMDQYDRIRDNISGITSILKDMNTLTPDMHRDSEFSNLYDAIIERLQENTEESAAGSGSVVAQKVEEARAEAERKAKEEADRIARAEANRLAARKAEEERLAIAKAEEERKAKEDADHLAAQKAEADRLARQKAEDERVAKARAETELKAKEEADRLAAQKTEADSMARQKAEDERVVKARAETERKAKEEADRLAAQKAEADKSARQKAEDEMVAKARAETERKAKEEADRLAALAAQKAEAVQLAKQKAEDERIAKTKADAERKAKATPVEAIPVEMKVGTVSATNTQKKPASKGLVIGIVAVVVLCVAGIGIGLSSLSNGGDTPDTEAVALDADPATEVPSVVDSPTEAPSISVSPTEAKSAQLSIPVTGPITLNTLSTSEASRLSENTKSFRALATELYGDQINTPFNLENTSLEPLRLSTGWCSLTQTILEDNLANMDFILEFNGQRISDSEITSVDFTDDGWACRVYFSIIDNWTGGTYSASTTSEALIPINDGEYDYEAGILSSYEYVVSIPSTSAQTSTTPETSAPLPAASEYFTEEFDQDPGWNYFLTSGDKNKITLDFNNSLMVFDLDDLDIYAYYRYEQNNYDDVRIDIRAENRGKNNNNVSLICRASDKGWYEFSTEGGGLWYLYTYKIDDSNQGTYDTVANGGALALKQGQEVNEYGMICKGNEITLIINGEELRKVVDSNNTFLDGYVGFNISSLNVTPIIVAVDWFKVSSP